MSEETTNTESTEVATDSEVSQELDAFEQAVEALDNVIEEEVEEPVEETEETSSEEKKEEPAEEKKEPLSKAWTKLQQKERQLNAQAAQIKQLTGQVYQFQQAARAAKQNPIQFLQSVGLSLDDITNYVINGPKPVDPRDQQLQMLHRQVAQMQQQKVEQENKAALNNYVGQINNNIQNTDKFPLLKAQNDTDVVVEVSRSVLQKEKRLLTADEACQMVENYLQDQREKLLKADGNSSPNRNSPNRASGHTNSTLTNRMQSQPVNESRSLDEQERFEAAVKALESLDS